MHCIKGETMTNFAYIKEITTENTGGGCMVDFVHLHDGRVIGLNDECVVLYQNMDEFWNATPQNKPSFALPPIKRMTNEQMADLAQMAANEAIKYCQDKLGVETGDFAGLHFSNDEKWNSLTTLIFDYIYQEISQGANHAAS
jgi:hypothetical protein